MEKFNSKLSELLHLRRWSKTELSRQLKISPQYLSTLLNEPESNPGGPLIALVDLLLESARLDGREGQTTNRRSGIVAEAVDPDIVPAASGLRFIPVLQWDDMEDEVSAIERRVKDSKQRREPVPLEVADKKAFALTVSGDAMEPRYPAGGIAIVTPSEVLREGLVIGKLKGGAVWFRWLTWKSPAKGRFFLIAGDTRLPATEHTIEDFDYLWPVARFSVSGTS